MNINQLISKLKEMNLSNEKSNDSIVYKSFQVRILDGYFGTVINQNKKTNKYEVFSYLKNKYDIASSLNLKEFKDVHKATEYFNEILELVNSESVDKVIDFCKNCK